MIDIEDFKSYFHQNFSLIELLRENNSLVYDRISDVLKVLGFIEMLADEDKTIEEDFEVIFKVGFSFFHEQFEEIKAYYNDYFKRDFPKFLQYETLINYTLYLEDLEEVLKEKSMYNEDVKTAVNSITGEIDKILSAQLPFELNLLDNFNEILEHKVPVGVLTTLEIFAMIVEELVL
jgi:hypothetical protein